MSEVKKNKRQIIKEAIEAGQYTKEQLMELSETDAAGFASQLSYLRMSGTYPIVGEDGFYTFTTEEEWNAKKAAPGKPKVELTPAAMRTKLEKKAQRAASAQTNAARKAKETGDEVDKLKAKRADLELKITELELGRHQAEFGDDLGEVPAADLPAATDEDLM